MGLPWLPYPLKAIIAGTGHVFCKLAIGTHVAYYFGRQFSIQKTAEKIFYFCGKNP